MLLLLFMSTLLSVLVSVKRIAAEPAWADAELVRQFLAIGWLSLVGLAL
jgi:hypothetical protein